MTTATTAQPTAVRNNAETYTGPALAPPPAIRGGWSRTYLALVDGALPRTLTESLRRFHGYLERLRRTGKAKLTPDGALVHPGWTRMGRELGLAVSQARVHMATLQELGLVRCVRRGGRGGSSSWRKGGNASLWTVTGLGYAYLAGNQEAHQTLRSRRAAAPIRVHPSPAGNPQVSKGLCPSKPETESNVVPLTPHGAQRQEEPPPAAHTKSASPPAAGTQALTAAVERLHVKDVVDARIARLGGLAALPARLQEVTQAREAGAIPWGEDAAGQLLAERLKQNQPLTAWERRLALQALGLQN